MLLQGGQGFRFSLDAIVDADSAADHLKLCDDESAEEVHRSCSCHQRWIASTMENLDLNSNLLIRCT